MQHHFDVDLAVRYGVAESILLNHLEYWIEHNRANQKNFFEGRYWTFNSNKALCEIFPYLSDKKIRNAIKHLQEEGLIVTGNFNKSPYDRTLWYSITEKGESILPKGQMKAPKRANESTQKGEPIPPNNTPNCTPNDQDSGGKRPAREQHGEYGWVKLSDAEYNKLLNDYGIDKLNHTIKYIDELAQSTGNKNKWKDWNLVVRRAIRDGWGIKPGEIEEEPKKQRRFETVLIDGEYVSVEV